METIVFSEPPPEGEPQEDTENPFGDPFLRNVFERARDQGRFVIPAQLLVDPNFFLGQRLGRDPRFRREGDPIPSPAAAPKEPVHPPSASVPKEPAYPPPKVRPSAPPPKVPSPVELQTPKTSASSSRSTPAVVREVPKSSVVSQTPKAPVSSKVTSPVEHQTAKASAASSSSSRPAIAKAVAIRPAVVQPKAKAIAISSVGEEDERWDPTILRIGAEI